MPSLARGAPYGKYVCRATSAPLAVLATLVLPR